MVFETPRNFDTATFASTGVPPCVWGTLGGVESDLRACRERMR